MLLVDGSPKTSTPCNEFPVLRDTLGSCGASLWKKNKLFPIKDALILEKNEFSARLKLYPKANSANLTLVAL